MNAKWGNVSAKTALAAAAAMLLSAGVSQAAPGRKVETKTTDYDFAYSYPAAAGRIQALKAWLDQDAASNSANIASEARDGRADAKDSGLPFNPYDSSTEWKVVTDLPAWLSLSGMQGEYTGGAHPNHGPMSLLWDKIRNRRVRAIDLFASPAALSAATRTPFCAALDRQRAERRDQHIDPRSSDPFDECLDPAEQVLILGSADHAHFTRLGFLMGPYAAGPYVEGDYEVTLPVTPAVLAAVRPEYRASFALAGPRP